jgi:hypothetical protein
MADDLKELSLRIEKMEKMLESLAGERAQVTAADLSADEVKAFQKVRDVIAADFGRFCGINDCFRCIIVRCATVCQVVCDVVCTPCDIECSCGPCNPGGLRGRVGRFGSLG